MLKPIDDFLNALTMYKLLLYGLGAMAVWAGVMALAGMLPYTVLSLVVSLGLLFVVCYGTNQLFGRVLKAPLNAESASITALILFFILPPVVTGQDALVVGLAGFAAMATKFLLAYHKKNLFNPTAAGAVVVSVLGIGGATWWVATPVLMPLTLIMGALIIRKIRRWWLFMSFLVCALISSTLANGAYIESYGSFARELALSWPFIFFGTVMLTEPLTTPPTQRLQIAYGILVGCLFGVKYSFGPVYASPEMTLVVANIFSFLVSPKYKLFLRLDAKRKLTETVYEFVFKSPQQLVFKPGQYMEWTLPSAKVDSRGNRRYFTIASSPTEPDIKLGIKVPEKASSFKGQLVELEQAGSLVASQLAGDFTLPDDPKQKLVFVAGGIGVTPFRSMAQYLIDTRQQRDVVLLYTSSSTDEFPYMDIFKKAATVGLRTVCCVTKAECAPAGWTGLVGRLTTQHITKTIPDYVQRIFYLSGPNAMVSSYEGLLHELGVPTRNIKKDYFPGF